MFLSLVKFNAQSFIQILLSIVKITPANINKLNFSFLFLSLSKICSAALHLPLSYLNMLKHSSSSKLFLHLLHSERGRGLVVYETKQHQNLTRGRFHIFFMFKKISQILNITLQKKSCMFQHNDT